MNALATQTAIAIDKASTLTNDKRKLLVFGRPDWIDQLRNDARWKDLPSCFRPNSVNAATVVGSFYGVPVGAILGAPDGLAILLDGEVCGGVSIVPDLGVFASYHVQGGAQIRHDELTPVGGMQ